MAPKYLSPSLLQTHLKVVIAVAKILGSQIPRQFDPRY
jgi:hypothetical protein